MTRTAKSAKGKTALTLLGVLALLSVGVFAYAKGAKADFALSAAPGKRTVEAGKSTSYTVNLKRLRKFKGSVTLGVKGLPTGARASWSAGKKVAKANVIKKNVKSATLTIATVAGTAPGTSRVTVTGKSGRLKHSKTVQLVVTSSQTGGQGGGPQGGGPVGNGNNQPAQTSFTIGASPATRTIPQSDSASYDVAIDRSGGYTGPVALTVTGLPAGASVPATSASNSSTSIPVDTTNSTPTGIYSLVITGTGTNGVTSASAATLVVIRNLPFTISGNAGSGLVPGASQPLNLTLSNPNSFQIRVDGLTVDPPAISGSAPGCAADNFGVTQIAATALPITLSANETKTLTAAGVADSDKPRVRMIETGTNQDACKSVSLALTYSGTAIK